MNQQLAALLNDYILGDRRLADRSDLCVRLGRDTVVLGDPVYNSAVFVMDLTTGSVIDPKMLTFDSKVDDELRYTGNLDDLLAVFGDPRTIDLESRRRLVLLGHFLAIKANADLWKSRGGTLLKSVRLSMDLSISDVATRLGKRPRDVHSWEVGSTPGYSDSYKWCRALGLVCPADNALVHFVDLSPALFRFLQEDPERLRFLTPDEFERFVAGRLDRMGYNVTLTGSTNTRGGGIDLIAVPRAANLGSVVLAGQVKHHRGGQKTGRGVVDRMASWREKGFGVGLLVTNTAFTRDALWAANRDRLFLRLRDFNT